MDETAEPSPESRLQVDRAFVEEHTPWMLGLATKILLDRQLAEDAVQETLFAVHKKRSEFEGRANLRTWLYRITVNAALNLRRKKASDSLDHHHHIDELQPDFDSNACRIEEPWQSLSTTEEVLEQAELTAFVKSSVELLPDDYRICLQLRDFEELSVREVAVVLNISEQNVKVRTHRARSALKRLLEPLLRGQPVSEITAGVLPNEINATLGRMAKGVMMAYMPMMITCEQFEDFIMDYLEHSLPEKKRRLFEFHIRTCRECREYLAAYQRTREIARESFRVALGEVPEDLLRAVTHALDH